MRLRNLHAGGNCLRLAFRTSQILTHFLPRDGFKTERTKQGDGSTRAPQAPELFSASVCEGAGPPGAPNHSNTPHAASMTFLLPSGVFLTNVSHMLWKGNGFTHRARRAGDKAPFLPLPRVTVERSSSPEKMLGEGEAVLPLHPHRGLQPLRWPRQSHPVAFLVTAQTQSTCLSNAWLILDFSEFCDICTVIMRYLREVTQVYM